MVTFDVLAALVAGLVVTLLYGLLA